MRPYQAFVAGPLALASLAAASHDLLRNRGAGGSYSKIVYTTVYTSIGISAVTFDSFVEEAGPRTFIEGVLTINFENIPAYFYMETETDVSTVITSVFTTSVKMLNVAHAATTSKKSLSTSSATTEAIEEEEKVDSDSNKHAIDHSPKSSSTTRKSKTLTKAIIHIAPTPSVASCDGVDCESGMECADGQCYHFETDDNNCGSLGNVCAGTLQCSNSVCVDLQTDLNNCGKTHHICGGIVGDGYACAHGKCIDLSNNHYNCGTLGNECEAGTGCDDGNCIDTTNDDDNCFVVGYACPSGTHCTDSECE